MNEVFKHIPDVQAFFSTRHNGVSTSKYESLNLGFHVGDEASSVQKNHDIIKSNFDKADSVQYMKQIHSNIVCKLGRQDEIPSCDALLTHEPKKILMVMVADCIPILFYDAKQKIISCIHAGRAGAFENIVDETYQMMKTSHDCKAEDIHVAIGPHIKLCCYEIGDDLARLAIDKGYEKSLVKKERSYYLDIFSIVKKQLHNLGIQSKNIEYSNVCTACNTQSYFSYRKEGETGRFCGVIMLK